MLYTFDKSIIVDDMYEYIYIYKSVYSN